MVWKKGNGVKETAIGNIIMAIALIVGVIFLGYSAVQNISSMFMEELAGRREQFVESKLEDYINSLEFAVELLTTENLSSEKNFQSYQYRLKHVYGLERFAFVDSNGLIYTSNGIRNDIDLYDFDYKNLSKPEISLKKAEDENKTLIVAIPINNKYYNKKKLVVSFMEITIARLLEGVSLQLDTNSAASCNIYTKDGKSLKSMVLGGLTNDENLFTAMEHATFEDGYTIDKIRSDGNAHLVEVQDGIVPAKTAVILECNSTEVANNRLLPLLTDPAELTGTNLLKGEIYLKDGSDDESNYRTLFDPQTMRVLSNDKAAFTNENIKDDAHNNVTLTYIANNTCYLDVSKIRKPKNEIKFTKDDIEPLLGDVNEDGKVNIIDVLAIANYIINIPQEVFNFNNGDTDFNNTINVIDMMWVVNYILAHQ